MTEKINADIEFEHSDANVRALGWILVVIVIAGVGLHFGLNALYGVFAINASASGRETEVRGRQRPMSGAPQLLVIPEADIDQVRTMENQKLGTYGWVDKEKGIVHIPIDQAMKMIAERGAVEAKPAVQPVQKTK